MTRLLSSMALISGLVTSNPTARIEPNEKFDAKAWQLQSDCFYQGYIKNKEVMTVEILVACISMATNERYKMQKEKK